MIVFVKPAATPVRLEGSCGRSRGGDTPVTMTAGLPVRPHETRWTGAAYDLATPVPACRCSIGHCRSSRPASVRQSDRGDVRARGRDSARCNDRSPRRRRTLTDRRTPPASGSLEIVVDVAATGLLRGRLLCWSDRPGDAGRGARASGPAHRGFRLAGVLIEDDEIEEQLA
jgi:hypothetical protein